MMVDREVGSTFRTDVAMMVVMLSLRLPKVIFSRGRELLAWRGRRRFGLRRDDRERCRRMQRQAVAFLDRRFVEIVVDRRPRRIKTRIAESCTSRDQNDRQYHRRRSEDSRPRHLPATHFGT